MCQLVKWNVFYSSNENQKKLQIQLFMYNVHVYHWYMVVYKVNMLFFYDSSDALLVTLNSRVKAKGSTTALLYSSVNTCTIFWLNFSLSAVLQSAQKEEKNIFKNSFKALVDIIRRTPLKISQEWTKTTFLKFEKLNRLIIKVNWRG